MTFIAQDPLLGAVDLSIPDNAGSGPFNLTTGKMGRQSFFGQRLKAYDPNLGGGEFIYVQAGAANVSGQTISSITSTGGIATVTTASAHGLTPGAVVILAGQVPTSYIGTWTIATVPSTTTYTINHGNTTLGAATTVGTYTYGPIFPGSLVSLTDTLSSGAVVTVAAPYAGTANTGQRLAVAYVGLTANQYGWVQTDGVAVTNVSAGAPASGNPVYCGTSGAVTPTAAAGKQVIGATFASAVSGVVGQGSQAVTLLSSQALVRLSGAVAVQTQIT